MSIIDITELEPRLNLETRGNKIILKPSRGSRCIYDKSQPCSPDRKSEICQKCPYGFMYHLKDLFKRIVGLAINLLRQERQGLRINPPDKSPAQSPLE